MGSRLCLTFFHASSKVLTLRLAMATVRTMLLRATGRGAEGRCCGSCAPPKTRLCCMTVLPAIIAATLCCKARRARVLQLWSGPRLHHDMHACDMHIVHSKEKEAREQVNLDITLVHYARWSRDKQIMPV